MSDAKISELTAYTTPIDTDVLPIVDVTNDITKKITYNGLSSNSLYRQAIINGNFDVWQRGTSVASVSSATQYLADRWQIFSVNTATTFSRQTSGLDTAKYSLRVQRNAGNTATNALLVAQNLETTESLKLVNQKLTISFWAKAGANYSPTSSLLGVNILSGTGTDQNIVNGLTGQSGELATGATLTTSWQKFTYTTTNTIANTKTQIAVSFVATPTGTAGAADYFEIAQVQLCAGSVALPFQPKSFAEELRDCQRYYQRFNSTTNAFLHYAIGFNSSSTVSVFVIPTKVTMRIAPTSIESSSANTFLINSIAGASIGLNDASPEQVAITTSVASGLTASGAARLFANNTTSAFIAFSAEL